MTLSISNFYEDPDTGEFIYEEFPAEVGADLFGLESYREYLWGSQCLINLGAKYLPKLKNENLFVTNNDLKEFECEILHLKDNFKLICNETSVREDSFLNYLNNAIKAVQRCQHGIGGVCIE